MPVKQHTNKRIVILTYGSRGDVEPFVALGIGLQKAGHTVCLAAPAPFAAFAERYGLEFAPIAGDPDELSRGFAERAGLNGLRMVGEMVKHVLPLARSAFATVEGAARGADLIIHSFLMLDAGHTLARSQGIPDISAQFFPMFLPTSAFPAVALPDLALGGWYRRGTHAFVTAIFRYGSRLMYRRLRASAPELPHLAPWPFSEPAGMQIPILFAYSPHILPHPVDWPPTAHVTGYWRLPPPADWTPPDELVRFLESGPPPVYFGPGSMQTKDLHRLVRMVVNAARACGQRVVLGVPSQEIEADLMGVGVFAAAGVPHAWLFPRMGYILHHGGAGTTGAAAAAGISSTAVPFSADQAFWARRLHRLGVGPAAPSARRLTGTRLEALMKDALENPAYRQRAGTLGEHVRSEDGVATAVGIIKEILGIEKE